MTTGQSSSPRDIHYSLGNFSDDEKREIVLFIRDLQEGKRIKRSSIRKFCKDDFYVIPAMDMAPLLGVNELELQALAKVGEFPARDGRQTERTYDLKKVLRCLWDRRGSGKIDVDRELKQKKIIGEDIKNKIRLRQWISKEKAEDRSVRILRAAMNMIQYAIKKASPALVGCPNQTDAEQLLTMKFREAVTLLQDEAQNKEWTHEISDEIDIGEEQVEKEIIENTEPDEQ